MKHAVILSLTSDIGLDLAIRLAQEGYSISGTYRSIDGYTRVKKFLPSANLIKCDLTSEDSIKEAITLINQMAEWDLFVSCPCNPLPLESFYESSIDEWEESFQLNSLNQLRFLHGIYKSIERKGNPTVMFFAGGGTNNAVDKFSAYTSAKIHLIKMIELLAHEDQRVRYLILGPGWTDTKTHQITLANTPKDSIKHREVLDFLANPAKGTPLKNIFDCLKWLMTLDPKIVSGRNYSVVHDLWSEGHREILLAKLKQDLNFYKLRRYGNDVIPSYLSVSKAQSSYPLRARLINLMKNYPSVERPIHQRFKSLVDRNRMLDDSDYGNITNDTLFNQLIYERAHFYGERYFDGSRNEGYGGYEYDKKFWKNVAKDIVETYDLKAGDRVLEVGCAKGFLLHDLKGVEPNLELHGIDISKYAVSKAMEDVSMNLKIGDAYSLPYHDKSFDIVICINTLSELPIERCKQAIREIIRVSKKYSFITLNSWDSEAERENLEKWNLTALSNFSKEDWIGILNEVGYSGDYYWVIAAQ